MKIVIPMAGRGSRFADRGYNTPKPFIPVAGQPMLQRALHSIDGVPHSERIVIALAEHERDHQVTKWVQDLLGAGTRVILLPDVTEGQLATVLAARDFIDKHEDVLIVASDTYVDSNLVADIANKPDDCRGIISVANMPGDRWSFARADESGRVVEVAEKVRISDHASTGMYYFSSGRELVSVGDEMMRNAEKTRGEYYVIPAYQKLIERGLRVDISQARKMWDMGNPEALAIYENHLRQSG
jgi:NDP-sugar pyrophosphorylase family protein